MRRGPADRLVAIARRLRRFAGAGLLVLACAAPAAAGPREQAKRMHDRLVGVPPTEAILASMAAKIAAERRDRRRLRGDAEPLLLFLRAQELRHALDERGSHGVRGPQRLHGHRDRDDPRRRPVRQVLSADLVYVGAPGVVAAAYSQTNNDHYRQLEAARVNLGDPTRLVPALQSTLPGAVLVAGETAGVITTRAAGEAFFSAGTNRRMWRFTTMNFLCRDMEQLKDVSRPTDRIRQDVSRSPGGDSSVFHNHCTGCHSGMDPMAGAYAYYEWDAMAERVVYLARAGAAEVPDQRQHLPLRIRHDRRPLGQLLARGSDLGARLARQRVRRLRRQEPRARGGGEPRLLRVPGREGLRATPASGRSGRPRIAPPSSASRMCSRRTATA